MEKGVIKVQNCYSFLTTNNDDVNREIWRALRHREKNYFHSTLYKRRLWDGYTEFFKKDTGRFLTGLLPEVEAALKHFKVEYKIVDERGDFNFLHNKIDTKIFKEWLPKNLKHINPHDYQIDLINQILRFKRGIIQAPTSAGKTFIMMGILKALPPKTPTLIVSNTKSLVDQIYEDMKEWEFDDLGRLYAKYKEPNFFTVATIQSLHKIERLLPKIKVLMVDEIHLGMSNRPKKFYNKMKACSVRIGVSATPFKFGGTDRTQKFSVKGYFGPIMRSKSAGILTTSKLQSRKILSSSKCWFYPIHEPKLPYDLYGDAITNGIAESFYFHKIVTRLACQQKGRTLILVERLAHGDALEEMILGALWVRGKDNLDTRRNVIKKLQSSKEDVVAIATKGIFNAGINIFINNLINAAGGKADHEIIQRMGRGLRIASDKDGLKYYDFVFQINDYLYDHSMKRIKILEKEGHEVIVKEEVDF